MSASPRNRSRSRSRSPVGEANTIFVGGLPHETDEKSLREHFSHLGDVVETKICYDFETGRSRGFGFVKFTTQDVADEAVSKMDGKMIGGRYVRCNIAKYNRGRGRGRGDFNNYGGRGGGRGGGREAYGYNNNQQAGVGRGYAGRGYHNNGPGGNGANQGGGPGGGGYQGAGYRGGERDRGYDRDAGAERRGRSASRSRSRGSHSPARSHDNGAGSRSPKRRRRDASASPSRATSPSRRGSASSSSTSSSSSSDDGEHRSPSNAPAKKRALSPGPPPAARTSAVVAEQVRKGLAVARRRESELVARCGQMESELHQQRASTQQLHGQAEALAQEVQVRDGVISKYRTYLRAVLECSRKLLLGRQMLADAEKEVSLRQGDLGNLVNVASEFLNLELHAAAVQSAGATPGVSPSGVAVVADRLFPDPLLQSGSPNKGGGAVGGAGMQPGAVNGLVNGVGAAAGGAGAYADLLDIPAAKFQPGIKFKVAV